MTTGMAAGGPRCVHCKVAVSVPEHYAHGDHIKCGACGTKHKVVRGEQLRLVLADPGPVREAIALNDHTAARLEEDLARVRRGVGIGANGLAVALAYGVYQVGVRHEPLGRGLLVEVLGIAIAIFVLLELANWAFLGKRQRLTTLTRELQEARAEGARLRTILRDATRV